MTNTFNVASINGANKFNEETFNELLHTICKNALSYTVIGADWTNPYYDSRHKNWYCYDFVKDLIGRSKMMEISRTIYKESLSLDGTFPCYPCQFHIHGIEGATERLFSEVVKACPKVYAAERRWRFNSIKLVSDFPYHEMMVSRNFVIVRDHDLDVKLFRKEDVLLREVGLLK